MTNVKLQNQNFRPRNLARWALTCYGGTTRERLLNASGRPYTPAYCLYVIHFRLKSPMDYFDSYGLM
jgi:hypothetical protein